MGAQDNRITSLTIRPEHINAQSSPVTYGHPDITLQPNTRGRRRNPDRRRKNPAQSHNGIPPTRPFTRRHSPPATAHQRHNASQKQSRRQPPPFTSHDLSLPTSTCSLRVTIATMILRRTSPPIVAARAHLFHYPWIPAFAGMTGEGDPACVHGRTAPFRPTRQAREPTFHPRRSLCAAG